MSKRVAACAQCNRLRQVAGRGLCGGCYAREWFASHGRHTAPPSNPNMSPRLRDVAVVPFRSRISWSQVVPSDSDMREAGLLLDGRVADCAPSERMELLS